MYDIHIKKMFLTEYLSVCSPNAGKYGHLPRVTLPTNVKKQEEESETRLRPLWQRKSF